MDEIHSILLEETRANFFQLENLFSNLDMKAFGLAAISALLFSIFSCVITLFEPIPIIMYIPFLILIISLFFLVFCIWPQG